MKANGVSENSAQYMALQREIVSTENSLKNLEKQANQSNVAIQAISATAQEVANTTGKLADKTKALSVAAAGLLTSLAGAAYSAATTADELNTLAKQSGFTTEELQKMQYAGDIIDVSMETIVGASSKLKNAMKSTSTEVAGAFQKLNVSTKDIDGKFRNIGDVFWDTVEALSTVANETERDTLSMTLFGESADKLAGIIDDGGRAFWELGKEAEQAGIILDQSALNKLNEVNNTIDKLKASFKGTVLVSGAKALEAAMPVLEKVAEKIALIFEFISKLNEEQIGAIIKIAAIVAALSPLLTIASKIATLFTGLPAIMSAVSAAFTFMTGPIGLTILAIGALSAAVILLVKHWDTIKEKTAEVCEAIKNTVKNMINGIVEKINGLLNRIGDSINAIVDAINKIQFDLPEILGGGHFGFNLKRVSMPQLPMLANGGTITSGSAIVGENGAELLTMMGGAARVTPLQSGKNGITIEMNNTFNGYNSATGRAAAKDLIRAINRELGRAY